MPAIVLVGAQCFFLLGKRISMNLKKQRHMEPRDVFDKSVTE